MRPLELVVKRASFDELKIKLRHHESGTGFELDPVDGSKDRVVAKVGPLGAANSADLRDGDLVLKVDGDTLDSFDVEDGMRLCDVVIENKMPSSYREGILELIIRRDIPPRPHVEYVPPPEGQALVTIGYHQPGRSVMPTPPPPHIPFPHRTPTCPIEQPHIPFTFRPPARHPIPPHPTPL